MGINRRYSAAKLIPVEDHEKIFTEEDKESEAYENVRSLLSDIVEANTGLDDIYTLRKTEKENIWKFVVNSYQEEDINQNGIIEEIEEGAQIGEEFDVSSFSEMKKGFDEISADQEAACDRWGCWLSGYAPIRNEEGVSVAMVGVDVSAQNIIDYESNMRKALFFLFGIVFLVFPAVIYLILNIFTKPILIILHGIRSFSEDFSFRINLKSGDEFQIIAETFNQMAKKMENLYGNMNDKVKNKTWEVEEKIEKIEEEKAKDEALISSLGEGMVAMDKEGKIVMMNKKAEEILGCKKEMIFGRHCKDIEMEDEKGIKIEENQRPVNAVLREKRMFFSNKISIVRVDGIKVPISITANPIMLKGDVIGVVIIFRDITEEKEIEKTKTEFVSIASHQLRTPLSSISWYTEMLLDENSGSLSPKHLDYLRKIYESNKRMTELVGNLLNVSRIDLNTFSINLEEVNVNEIVNEIVDELRPMIESKSLNLEEKYAENLPIIKADPILMRIVFQNLISNSVKYTPSRGSVSVSVSKDKKDNILIAVSDSGYGIKKNQQDRIFSKFFRADNIRKIEPNGSGLGLYIIKSIVDQSGGSISFKSEEDKGTEFVVKFPITGMKSKKGLKKLS
jgi:two-component system phosphate regulon sensor histidine kinase PhoR